MSKKGAKNTKEVRQYDVGDIVLGKIRGYPPWPAVVSPQGRVKIDNGLFSWSAFPN